MAGSQSDASSTFDVEGDRPALVRPGVYDLRFDHHATAIMFGRVPKLILHFTIIEIGTEYFDKVRVPRYYNVLKLLERPRKGGRFKVGFKSDFLRDYARLFGIPQRLDRVPMTRFTSAIVRGRIKTVSHGSDQREIPDGLRYSVVEELVAVKAP